MNNPDEWPPAKRTQVAAKIANSPDAFMEAMIRHDVELPALERMMDMEGYAQCELCELWQLKAAIKPLELLPDPAMQADVPMACTGCALEYA